MATDVALGCCRVNGPEFPVEPRLSKVLLSSFEFGCTEEVLTIVALLQVQNLWTNPKGR